MQDGTYSGVVGWLPPDDAYDLNIIVRRNGGELAFDFLIDDCSYTAKLTKCGELDHVYSGEYSRTEGGVVTREKAHCSLLNDGDRWVVYGFWIEDGLRYTWSGELSLDE
ncbi:TPA: hypothetical protein ACSP74_002475 [Aeromonas veronii]